MSIVLNFDPEIQARLSRLAEVSNCTPEALLGQAIDQYLKQNENPERASEARHPSGKPWPQRNPVGGIITPV